MLAEYRRKLANLLIETCFIPTSTSVFNFLLTDLWSNTQPLWQVRFEFELKTHSSHQKQQHVERTFWVLRVLGRNLDPREGKWGPQIMFFIESLPSNDETPLQLRLTVIELIGQMAQWLAHHPDNINNVLARLTQEIQVKELTDAATDAVVELCSYCRKVLSGQFEQLVQLVRYTEAADFPTSVVLKLYQCISQVQAQFAVEDTFNSINALLAPLLQELQAVCYRDKK